MSATAFNKVNQTHTLFRRIISPLKQSLDLSFGYMIVFEDGGYYTLVEDMQCLHEFVTNVTESHIFCNRNVSNYFDTRYNFTLWPEFPISTAMEIYHKYNMWNGITVSKVNDHYTELYWFTHIKAKVDWHKFFIRNKQLLLEFTDYFNTYKKSLFLSTDTKQQDLFKFKQGFEINIPKSEYMQESDPLKSLLTSLRSDALLIKASQQEKNFSRREIEVLSIACRGFTTKIIAHKLDISVKTVNTYIERIKIKTGLHFKTELIEFYEKEISKHI